MLSLLLIIAACAIGFTSAAVTPHSFVRWSSRHNGLQPVQKRASGQFTYYAVGMGACGQQNAASDFVRNSDILVVPHPNSIFQTGRRAKHPGKLVIIATIPDSPVADRITH